MAFVLQASNRGIFGSSLRHLPCSVVEDYGPVPKYAYSNLLVVGHVITFLTAELYVNNLPQKKIANMHSEAATYA